MSKSAELEALQKAMSDELTVMDEALNKLLMINKEITDRVVAMNATAALAMRAACRAGAHLIQAKIDAEFDAGLGSGKDRADA